MEGVVDKPLVAEGESSMKPLQGCALTPLWQRFM
jgi:hypothetical protein